MPTRKRRNSSELILVCVNKVILAHLPTIRYKYNTDKLMQVLKFTDLQGKPIGVISWFAVHGTSMNNSNKLISGDNKGYAAMRFEQDYNGYVNVGKVWTASLLVHPPITCY